MFNVTKRGVNANGLSNNGYVMLSKSPTPSNMDMLSPTDRTNFIINSVLSSFSIEITKNPGIIVKNKNGIISLKNGIFSNITRLCD